MTRQLFPTGLFCSLGILYTKQSGLQENDRLSWLHEGHPCSAADDCTEAAMVRNEGTKTTIYEIVFPAEAMGVDSLRSSPPALHYIR